MFEWLSFYFSSSVVTYLFIFIAGLAGFMLLFSLKKTEWIIYALLIWFPLESLILMHAPLEMYAYIKYTPEILLYGLAVGACIHYLRSRKEFVPPHPITRWIYIIVILAIITLLFRWYSPFIWSLGIRQLLRFTLLIFICLWMRYNEATLKKVAWIGIAMIVIEAGLGMIQYGAGGSLDRYLFSSQTVSVGNRAVIEGIEQTWTPGTRVFATLGRYDRLGSLLALGIIMLFPWMYYTKNTEKRWWLVAALCLLGICLVLTKSRASWIAAIVGVGVIGWYLKRDRKLLVYTGLTFAIMVVYLATFALARQNVFSITETRTQTLSERIFEAVSPYAWRQSYDGYGRIFFIVNTPRAVLLKYPFFGVGPGQYGGGVAAALNNTRMYDTLQMPFGIENKIGQIDNNWMSIWGEFGTIGLFAWVGLFIAIIKLTRELVKKAETVFERAIGEGATGLAVGIMCIGFFGPYFEFRALMFYFWLVIGMSAILWYRKRKSMSFLSL